MKKKDLKYIVVLVVILLVFILVELAAPKPVNWSITLEKDHKIPFGTYALHQMLPDLFPSRSITYNNDSFYDLVDYARPASNVIILADNFAAVGDDATSLLNMAEEGSSIFIAANYFSGDLSDTLSLYSGFSFFKNISETARDSVSLYLSDDSADNTREEYKYLLNHVSQHFQQFDSAKCEALAVNDDDKAVLLQVKWGKGALYLCSTPLVFTNYYILRDSNHRFVSSVLSYLPVDDVYWTNYYHMGRMEAQTPLRFILTQPPLKWAYFLVIGSIILFMLFEAKRKQRIIPVVAPPANMTLDFVRTVSNLYIKKSNNKNIAEKRIIYLLDHIRANYHLSTKNINDDFYHKLARKSGKSEDKIKKLFEKIGLIRNKTSLSATELLALNREIEDFYNH